MRRKIPVIVCMMMGIWLISIPRNSSPKINKLLIPTEQGKARIRSSYITSFLLEKADKIKPGRKQIDRITPDVLKGSILIKSNTVETQNSPMNTIMLIKEFHDLHIPMVSSEHSNQNIHLLMISLFKLL